MQRAVSVVRLALSLMWPSQQKQYIMFYNTVVLAGCGKTNSGGFIMNAGLKKLIQTVTESGISGGRVRPKAYFRAPGHTSPYAVAA
jgi:hypothetical protein